MHLNAEDKLLKFNELEARYGRDSANAILRTLEQFEGIREEFVASMTPEARLKNVLRLMSDNLLFQTRH